MHLHGRSKKAKWERERKKNGLNEKGPSERFARLTKVGEIF